MKKVKIGFIGGGNMGEALIAALLRKKIFRPQEIGVFDPAPERRRRLKKYKIAPFDSNRALVKASPVILLAVKPQQMAEVLREISPELNNKTLKSRLVISIAAGLDTPFIEKRLPTGTRVIRVMPNAPALIGEGASALYGNAAATAADRRLALKIFQAAGTAAFVDREEWLDVITALSGSGPAFVYEFIRGLIAAGESLGLSASLSRPLVLQTIIGACHLVEQSRDSLSTLIQKVASKGGTTEAGLSILRSGGFSDLIFETIRAATKRARELRGGA